MLTERLDYHLPEGLIATEPACPRDASRLMVVRRREQRVEHWRVADLPVIPDLLRPGDLMVFNETRVLPARFQAVRAGTGGRVSGLYLQSRQTAQGLEWNLLLEARGRLERGEVLELAGPSDGARLELIEALGQGQWRARLHGMTDTLSLLNHIGSTPLPPYIRKARRQQHQPEVQPEDQQRYNTVFATVPGSVAAPTASLHFTSQLLERIEQMGIGRALLTLHVGLGTFAPVRSVLLEDHPMHQEWLHIPAATLSALRQTRAAGGRIIPVGTTCVRALESLPDPATIGSGDYTGRTQLFIHPTDADQPPFTFRFTDALMTNFHLPRSTLLALVAALPEVGLDNLLHWYRIAIEQGYRFYSYGDAMLLI